MIRDAQRTWTSLVLLFPIAGLGALWAVPFSQAQQGDVFGSPVPTPPSPDQGSASLIPSRHLLY
jgi:hypothetical protein